MDNATKHVTWSTSHRNKKILRLFLLSRFMFDLIFKKQNDYKNRSALVVHTLRYAL